MSHYKKELRTKYKTLRQKFTPEQVETMSIAIANNLNSFAVWHKTYYHIFLPIEEQNEINTEIILHLLSGKDKEVVISKTDFDTGGMTHYLLTDNTKIKKNKYNIPEPIDGLEVPSSKIEVVFVPLLAFDQNGHRVGYGKGFYDRFLSECNPKTIKIGLSFFEAETEIEDVYDTDIALDYCITPERIYEFK